MSTYKMADLAIESIIEIRSEIELAHQEYVSLLTRLSKLEQLMFKINPYNNPKIKAGVEKVTDRMIVIREHMNCCELGSFKTEITRDSGLLVSAYRELP